MGERHRHHHAPTIFRSGQSSFLGDLGLGSGLGECLSVGVLEEPDKDRVTVKMHVDKVPKTVKRSSFAPW